MTVNEGFRPATPPTASGRGPHLSRVVVVGTAGSGKTTFARRLAQVIGGSHIELDALYWMPDWEPRPPDEFQRLARERAAHERWVADGNYRTLLQPILWPRATAVVWLNYSFGRTFGRAFVRTVRRSLSGEELFAGNRESLRGAFLSRQSIPLRTPAEAEHFLASIGPESLRQPAGGIAGATVPTHRQ